MTRIVFASRNFGKTAESMRQMNEALARGAAVALSTPLGAFMVPPRYSIEQPSITGCWSLRTPDGMLVRYRTKRSALCPAS